MLAGREDARRGDSTAPTLTGGGRKSKLTREQISELYRPVDDETKSILRGVVNRFGYLPRATAEGEDAPPRSPTTGYVLSVDFEEALSDLASLLAADEGPIMAQLGEMQVVTRHLAPMLIVVTRERWEPALFHLLDVLCLLTNPRTEANRASPTLLLGYCCQYKATFEDENLLRALLTLAVGCVTPRPETASNDYEFLRKILQLIRNVLATPDQGLAAGRYERLVKAMVDCRLVEFLLLATASVNDACDGRVFGPQAYLLAEIMTHLLTARDPQLLARAYEDGSGEGSISGTGPSDIERVLQGEATQMGHFRKPIRHSRFTGAFVVKLTSGENFVVAQSRIDERNAMDLRKRTQHRGRKTSIGEFGENAGQARSSELRMICQVGIDFVVGGGLDGLVQLAFGRSDPVLEDDPNAWCHLTLLMAWSLKLVLCLRRQPRSTMVSRSLPSSSHPASSILETAPSHPKAIDWDYVKPILHGERLTRQARYLRRLLNERQLALLQVGLRFFREALRALEFLVLGQNSPPWVQLAQGELFRHQDVLSIFRLILQTGCSRFSLQSLGVLMEVNHLMLKLLKRFCDQRGHMFVSRPLTKTILAGERGGGGFDDGYDVGAASHETDGPEREFHFIDLLEEYAHEAIIDKFTRLLQNATGANEIGTNRYLAIMLNHFVSGELQGACTLLFRASLLEASHSVLYYSDRRWRQANAVLVKVCQLLASRFVAQLRERPLLAVAIFFNLHHLLKGRQPPPDASMASDEAEQGVKDGISLPEHWQREERIAWLVRTLVEAEFSSAISWLTGKLFDAAAERAPTPGKASEETSAWPETGTEGGALPRTTPYYVYAQNDSIKEALGDPTFKALLCACGLEAPSRGERNWRVPVEMRLDDTLRVAQQLQSALRLAIDIGGEETLEWDKDQRTATKDENDNHGDTDDDRNSDDQGSDQLSEIPTTLVSDSTAGMFGESKGHLVRDKSKRPAGRWAQLKQSNFFLSARPLSSEEENSPTDDLHEQSDAGDDGKSTTHRKMNLSMDEDYDREAVLTDGDAPNPSREGEPKPKKPPLAIYSDSDE